MTPGRIARGIALVVAVCGTTAWIGCAAPADEAAGTAELAITNVPQDGSVFCIQVTATANITVQKLLDVTPGQSTVFQLAGLPVGAVAFTGEAFPAPCQAVGPNLEATWLSDPVIASVSPSPPVSVMLSMHRSGHAQVGVDFPPDPSCTATGGPCAFDTQCCSGSCDTTIGLCESGNQGCTTNAECPASPSECMQSVCNNGQCDLLESPAGTPVSTQVAGDCNVVVCDGSGAFVTVVDDSDIPFDGNQCTVDMCSNGFPVLLAAPLGSACNQNGGHVCGGNGACVECAFDFDCPGSAVCANNTCQVISCSDGSKNGPETDIDCGGGFCPQCAPGQACIIGFDCTSGVCVNNTCQTPSCFDGTRNGPETDVDCGGGCPGCANGHFCNTGSDCASGNCVNSICHA